MDLFHFCAGEVLESDKNTQNIMYTCHTLVFLFLRLHAVHGKNWVTIGRLLGRSTMSVIRKYLNLPVIKG